MNWNESEADSILRRYMGEHIGRIHQGIVLLHHALLTFQGWLLYTQSADCQTEAEIIFSSIRTKPSVSFKKKYGITPMEYRQSAIEGGQ